MKIKSGMTLLLILFFFFSQVSFAAVQEAVEGIELGKDAIFDDNALVNGYAQRYMEETKETLLAMIIDDSNGAYKTAAAVRIFKQKYANEVLKAQKPLVLRTLIRRLNRTDSPFVQVEIMHTLVVIDHYQYFVSMVPALILKMDHYNKVVNTIAFVNLQEILKTSNHTREARIVFNTLRKTFFLSRKRLSAVTQPDQKLKQKLEILRWSIKVLGTQQFKYLPQEVINLL